ncbi:leucine-rich repeat receptor-like serine/threonine-protein kinase BAM1 [Neltuma alba]|uniref:leucine-rich repeat receptor-like serine/threonine-protein kinase BAM1 n=1 Tax=Neltuma alba TaxID=207710 RepID=UPI0010A50BA2|nr:leucine-rich repeat receptor-like serine/threonine-protein kinase BAM1 [Prosopis alba]
MQFSSRPLLVLLSISTLHCLTVRASTCHPDDESGLLGFKSGITSDPSNLLASWKSGTDCCAWTGVTCLNDNKRVTSLFLSGQPDVPTSLLSGIISPSLSKLRFLDGIYLLDLKNISGSFPAFVSHLPNLQFIYIENNRLSGRIPENIGNLTRLSALSLSGNRFTGPIPVSISALTQLTQLKLGGNLLRGSVPNGIRRLQSLTFLSLEGNQLTGAIPDFFSSFPDLRILRLSRNKFSGQIPPSISSLAPKLSYLELGHNYLTGQIPDFLGKFKALDTLDLSSNRFWGTVPRSFGNLTKIFNLDLSNNFLVDPFPQMNVKGIESLDLSDNRFHLKEIPRWVTSSPIIFSLKLAKCGIKMKLEDWKPVETYFYDYIDLSGNEITGSPVGLLNRTEYLVGFRASENKLRFDLGKLKIVKTLKYLDLAKNSVFGKVPNAVAGLEKLNVSYNHLCGQIPKTKFPASAFTGNDCLCGAPLQPCKS